MILKQVYFIFLLLVLVSSAKAQATWKAKNTLPTSNSLFSLTTNGTQFVAVGANGTVITSTDKLNWKKIGLATAKWLYSVTWMGSQFVAVGDVGTILTSSDALVWTERTSGTGVCLYSVVWTGSQLVAVGELGTILTSFDGTTWSTRISGTSAKLSSLAWTDSKIVTVGDSGIILSSIDGLIWSSVTSGTKSNLKAVCWTGTKLVVAGTEGAIFTSTNYTDWTKRTSGSLNELRSIAWTGVQLVIVGSAGSVLISNDSGSTWLKKDAVIPTNFYSVIWADTQVVAVCGDASGGLGAIRIYKNSSAWSFQVGAGFYRLASVAWSGKEFVAVGSHPTLLGTLGGYVIITSQDGVSWIPRAWGEGADLVNVIWIGSRFVAMGQANTVLTSSDGVDWTKASIQGAPTLISAVWTGNQIKAVGDNESFNPVALSSYLCESGNGLIWNTRSLKVALPQISYSISWSGSLFVVVGKNGPGTTIGRIFTSPDGNTWTDRLAGGPPLRSVIWFQDKFVVVGEGQTLTSTSDPYIWNSKPTGGPLLNSIATREGQLVAVGAHGAIVTSLDGISWMTRDAGTILDLNSVTWTSSQIIAVGQDGIILSSPNAIDNFKYSTGIAYYRLGAEIPPNNPMSTGDAPTFYSISPNLPDGLVFDTSTGVITGKPNSTQSLATYKIRAGTSTDIRETTITISIQIPLSNLVYSTNPAIYKIGTRILNNTPTFVGTPPASFSVDSPLPIGLTLNTISGVISGVPTEPNAPKTFIITAKTEVGFTTSNLVISVAADPVSVLSNTFSDKFEIGPFGLKKYVFRFPTSLNETGAFFICNLSGKTISAIPLSILLKRTGRGSGTGSISAAELSVLEKGGVYFVFVGAVGKQQAFVKYSPQVVNLVE